MKKADLVKKMSDGAGITRAQAAKALGTFIKGVSGALKKGQTAMFVGFGSFKVARRAARKGRNPKTGAAIKIPARKVVRFTAGKGLKKLVSKH